ncbi:thyroid hormone receptor interactor 10b isoform X4 [Danio rerio]|uniref:Thyroid hormone receptor interactor 10b isoform X4 n=5 Tax=Danio rerio TaxID=7955 RepID=A0AC58JJ54_DANRE|nr:uncharacterized protein zmp:0000001172 [Danio rerio]|eukprot:XP_017212664.1 uncharacterized protein zmp:0000001172 [Danio rerio]
MLATLNEVPHLRNTGFGRPWPRHGLKLLHWFAKECLIFDNNNNMRTDYYPADGDFGFHLFENRCDEYGDKLLPDVNFPYYVVGNLNSAGAENLPEYVTEYKCTDEDYSNTDRIIVSLHDDCEFDKVYITQHKDRSNYDPYNTHRISKGLLMIIRRIRLEDFLEGMCYYPYMQPVSPMPIINYRPIATNTAGPGFIVVNYPHVQPISLIPNIPENPGFVKVNYPYSQPISLKSVRKCRPKSTNTVSPDLTAVTVPSSHPPHHDAPAAQSSGTNAETIITIEEETSTNNPSENSPKKKRFWERLCTIL